MNTPTPPSPEVDYQARCIELEATVARITKINEALMDRIERDMDKQGNAFSLFQAANALEAKVRERTQALKDAMRQLEQTNSELVKSNEAAQAASRAKSEFLATMSHEVRTPMNGVLGMTEILLSTSLDNAQRKAAETIHHSALSLLQILNDILDFSKIEAGRLTLTEAPFDLADQINQTLAPFTALAGNRQLTLIADCPETLTTTVVGDAGRFAQILINLVGNAIKFTRQGTVIVRLRIVNDTSEGVELRCEVHDSGIGIKPEVLVNLFSAFTQADGSTTRQFGGTGLGLAIVRRLSELMGGTCGATSEYGKGSCFWFTVKLRKPSLSERTAIAEITSAPSPPPRRMLSRILVVEDNPMNQEVAKAMLDTLHCETQVASNGKVALELLRTDGRFDMVFMDCQMPVMDGFEATRQYRAYEDSRNSTRRLPIIALTANAMQGDRERCLEAGMDDFMSKPFRISDLRNAIDKWTASRVAGEVSR